LKDKRSFTVSSEAWHFATVKLQQVLDISRHGTIESAIQRNVGSRFCISVSIRFWNKRAAMFTDDDPFNDTTCDSPHAAQPMAPSTLSHVSFFFIRVTGVESLWRSILGWHIQCTVYWHLLRTYYVVFANLEQKLPRARLRRDKTRRVGSVRRAESRYFFPEVRRLADRPLGPQGTCILATQLLFLELTGEGFNRRRGRALERIPE